MGNGPPETKRVLLLVEDNPGDARLVREAIGQTQFADELAVASDGEGALDYVYQRGEYSDVGRPDLILLDWHLPDMSGEDVLGTLKEDFSQIPVVVLSGSSAERKVQQFYVNGANASVTKPTEPGEFIDAINVTAEFWLDVARLPERKSDEDNSDHV